MVPPISLRVAQEEQEQLLEGLAEEAQWMRLLVVVEVSAPRVWEEVR